MRRFSLHKRGKVFYAQLRNPLTGGFLPAKSTRWTNRDEAVLIVNEWLQNGPPDCYGVFCKPENLRIVRVTVEKKDNDSKVNTLTMQFALNRNTRVVRDCVYRTKRNFGKPD